MAERDIMPWRRGSRAPVPFEGFRREIESLHRDMDRLFESLWGDGNRSLLPEGWSRKELMPELDVTEDEKAFHVHVELPGMDEKDVEVTLADRFLTIRGEKKESKETKESDYYRRERAYGTFRRGIEIPAAVDASGIKAEFKNGVLSIDLPKSKEAQEKVRRIDVKGS